MTDYLRPNSPDDALALFDLVRTELAASIGEGPALSHLTLMAVRHLMGDEMLRMLLIGRPGVGKTYTVRALASLLGLPFLEFSVSSMAEEGWKGVGPSEHISALFQQAAIQTHTQTSAKQAAERAIVLIDELDKARLASPNASPSTRENRLGKQRSLLPIVGDGTIHIERSGGDPLVWRSRRALVVCAGVFEGLQPEQPSAEDLSDWGLVSELAERLALGTILRLRLRTQGQMAHVLRSAFGTAAKLFGQFGYVLEIPEVTVNFLSHHLLSRPDIGTRSMLGIIKTGAEVALITLISHEAPVGTRHVLSPDDLRIPPASPGLWRE